MLRFFKPTVLCDQPLLLIFSLQIETVKKVSAHVEPTKSAATQIKEEVKLQQNSVIKPSFNASTPVSKYPTPAQHVALSPNFTNISAIKKKEEVKDVRRMLATPEGKIFKEVYSKGYTDSNILLSD